MWQRIQTLYLGIAAALTLSLFWLDLAHILGPEGAVEKIGFCDKPLYLYLVIACLAATLAALLTYRLRILQLRLCVIAALLLLGLQTVVAIGFFQRPEQMVYELPAVFPVAAAILVFLAARGVLLDEAMVRSSYRLRQGAKRRRKERMHKG